jgi:hypothetical protein
MEKIDTIVVSASSVLKALNGKETALEDAANKRATELQDDWQKAALMAQFGEALRDLENAERDTSARVLHSPQNPLAARLQSALAEQSLDLSPLSEGGQELKFDEVTDPFGWLWSVVHDWNADHHPIKRPASTDPTVVADTFKLVLFADWATGLYGAPIIRDTIQAMPGKVDLLMHLGDSYYAGSQKEIRQRLMAYWPKRTDALNRALNGNHEMYAGGWAYFDEALPGFKQDSSYFALQNSNWLFIALDTSHTDFDIDKDQAAWLTTVVKTHGSNRKVMLFSHHQIFSQLDHQGTNLAKSVGSLLQARAIDYWYWGHEHRCVFYDKHESYDVVARCIGHGGMPQRRGDVPKLPISEPHGDFSWRRLEKKTGVPAAVVLDGPNQYIKGDESKYSPHGFVTLQVDGSAAHEVCCLPEGTIVWDKALP